MEFRFHIHGVRPRGRAISEMLAVIILLALTIVAGVAVYQIFMGKSTVASATTAISIRSVDISGANGVMTITVQNTGSNVIKSITVTVYRGGSTVSISPGGSSTVSLTPGRTWSQVFTGSFVSGDRYTVTVKASSNTGSSTIATATVTAG